MHPQSHPWRRILSPLSISLLFFHSGSMGVDALGLIVGPHGLWLSQGAKKVLLCSVVFNFVAMLLDSQLSLFVNILLLFFSPNSFSCRGSYSKYRGQGSQIQGFRGAVGQGVV